MLPSALVQSMSTRPAIVIPYALSPLSGTEDSASGPIYRSEIARPDWEHADERARLASTDLPT